jgi:prevent-host-death family protein
LAPRDIYGAHFRKQIFAMRRTTFPELLRNFAEFQHQARRDPVEITQRGRREFVLVSAKQYDWLTTAAKRTHRTNEATSVVIDAVERAEMDLEYAKHDDLLK